MKRSSRYHPLLVSLHWLLAALILGMLTVGFVLRAMPNADPQKIDILRIHMAVGVSVLALMLIRFVVRVRTVLPVRATTGHRFLDRLARIIHYSFYVIVVLMVATGYSTAALAGLPAIVFGHSGNALPRRFTIYPTFIAHTLLAELLVVFVALHLFAALYHQFVKRDGLLGRMSLGRRSTGSPISEE